MKLTKSSIGGAKNQKHVGAGAFIKSPNSDLIETSTSSPFYEIISCSSRGHEMNRRETPEISLIEWPNQTAQLTESAIHGDFHNQTIPRNLPQPNSLFTGREAGNSRRVGNLQPKPTGELPYGKFNVEMILNSSWGELSRAESKVEHHPSDSWTGNREVEGILHPGGGKQRIRWTHELHMQFVEAVNSLGGAMKATPKGILRLMRLQGLTIFHIKSHLQKYRTTKNIPDYVEGKSGRRSNHDATSNLIGDGDFQISEAMRLQMDVQKSLHEHLEFQKNLQMRIEEHADYLQQMFDQQTKSRHFSESHNSNNKAVGPSVAECSSTGGYCDQG